MINNESTESFQHLPREMYVKWLQPKAIGRNTDKLKYSLSRKVARNINIL